MHLVVRSLIHRFAEIRFRRRHRLIRFRNVFRRRIELIIRHRRRQTRFQYVDGFRADRILRTEHEPVQFFVDNEYGSGVIRQFTVGKRKALTVEFDKVYDRFFGRFLPFRYGYFRFHRKRRDVRRIFREVRADVRKRTDRIGI